MGKRVLYVYYGKMNHHGLDLEVEHELLALVKVGYEVDFLSRGKVEIAGVRSVRPLINWSRVFSNFGSSFYYRMIQRFFDWVGCRMLRRGNYDLVIGWNGCALGLLQEARFRGVPSVLNAEIHHVDHNRVLHDMKIDCDRRRQEYDLADALVVHSDFCKETYTSKGIAEDRVHVAHRGADLEKFSLIEDRHDDVFRVVFFGRVCDRKGIGQALEVWEKAGLENAEFWMVGAIDKGVERVVEEALSDNVKHMPFTSTPEEYLCQCDVNIMPTESEGLAKSLVEGAACGLVTITTKESGFDIGEEHGVYHVLRDDIDGMAKLLKQFCENRASCHSSGREARAYVEKSFTWEGFHQRFAEIVEECSRGGAVTQRV